MCNDVHGTETDDWGLVKPSVGLGVVSQWARMQWVFGFQHPGEAFPPARDRDGGKMEDASDSEEDRARNNKLS